MKRNRLVIVACAFLYTSCHLGESTHLPIRSGLVAWYGHRHSVEGDGVGDWNLVGGAELDPSDETRLTTTPGVDVLFNGREGKTRDILTRTEYGDTEIHVEFMIPKGSNSGVYVMGRYEVQILDSYGKKSDELKSGDCGGIYQSWDARKPKGSRGSGGKPPRVNASRAPGEWQSFDITFRAPRFDTNGNKTDNARFVKVIHNGVLIHENFEVPGPTRAATWESPDDEKPTGPLMFQGDHGPVALRNLRVVSLEE